MGCVGVNDVNDIHRISPLLHSEEFKKKTVLFEYANLPFYNKLPSKNNMLDFFGASTQIAKNLLPVSAVSEDIKNENKKRKIEFLKSNALQKIEVDLKLENEAVINGMALFSDPSQKENFELGKAQNQKWIVYFNNNTEVYENKLSYFQTLLKDFEANFFVFNYRTTGESSGNFNRIEDLIVDAELCLQYLLLQGVFENDILILGHALGGALASLVAQFREKSGLICDRTFSSLSTAASARIPLSGQFLSHFGWDIDAAKAFDYIKNKKMVIYHKQDGVVPYNESSLYKFLKEKIKQSNTASTEKKMQQLHKVKLCKPFDVLTDDAHFYSFADDQKYDEIKKFVREFFAISSNNKNNARVKII